MDYTSQLFRPPPSPCDDSSSSGATPASWWLGSEAEFAAIRAARAEIHRREARMRRTAWRTFAIALLAAVSIYSTNAVGALHGPVLAVAMPASALVLILAAVWLIDRRLAQQIGDAGLQASVWEALVGAIRSHAIDAARLLPQVGESEVDRLLREEAALAVRFVASDEPLALHVPLFDESIELSRPLA